jgi:protein arginine kinase activator
MVCQQCGERDAVVNVTQIANDSVNTLHLCERCAAERGIETPALVPKTPLGSFIAAMGKEGEPGVATERRTCPGCGASLEDFRESGRLGCGECYITFTSPLRVLLRRLHGSMTHVGERYAAPGRAPLASVTQRIEELRQELRLAVEAEQFERAAELRDRLRGEEAGS